MILMNDFKSEPLEIRNEMAKAARRVIDSGWYILGKELENFEKEWASACSLNYGIGVGNGMDAIEIALRALDIGCGDEVVTTPMTAFASVLAIIRAGATPVLADIDPCSGLMSIDSVQRCITKKTKAVLLVHIYGQLRDMDLWCELCEVNNLYLIEDCAQTHSAQLNGKKSGSFGVAGAFSFYPTKNLGALGDAGMIVTNNTAVAKKSYELRNYGQSVRYYHPTLGMNSRLDEIQAAILSVRLQWLDDYTIKRQAIGARFQNGITSQKIRNLAAPQEQKSHVYHLYVVLSENRTELIEYLTAKNIQTQIHYPVPIHQQEPCKALRGDPKGLDVSVDHSKKCLSIPCHPQMSNSDVETIISALNGF
jgi:dTDP-4-amino-4,6-dideoxygalactose transaminase